MPVEKAQPHLTNRLAAGHRRDCETERMMHVVKDLGFVVKVVERSEALGAERVREEGSRGRIGSKSGRRDDPVSACRREACPEMLGEDAIGVDLSYRAEREPLATTDEVGLRSAAAGLE
jgi:hypothetical protein